MIIQDDLDLKLKNFFDSFNFNDFLSLNDNDCVNFSDVLSRFIPIINTVNSNINNLSSDFISNFIISAQYLCVFGDYFISNSNNLSDDNINMLTELFNTFNGKLDMLLTNFVGINSDFSYPDYLSEILYQSDFIKNCINNSISTINNSTSVDSNIFYEISSRLNIISRLSTFIFDALPSDQSSYPTYSDDLRVGLKCYLSDLCLLFFNNIVDKKDYISDYLYNLTNGEIINLSIILKNSIINNFDPLANEYDNDAVGLDIGDLNERYKKTLISIELYTRIISGEVDFDFNKTGTSFDYERRLINEKINKLSSSSVDEETPSQSLEKNNKEIDKLFYSGDLNFINKVNKAFLSYRSARDIPTVEHVMDCLDKIKDLDDDTFMDFKYYLLSAVRDIITIYSANFDQEQLDSIYARSFELNYVLFAKDSAGKIEMFNEKLNDLDNKQREVEKICIPILNGFRDQLKEIEKNINDISKENSYIDIFLKYINISNYDEYMNNIFSYDTSGYINNRSSVKISNVNEEVNDDILINKESPLDIQSPNKESIDITSVDNEPSFKLPEPRDYTDNFIYKIVDIKDASFALLDKVFVDKKKSVLNIFKKNKSAKILDDEFISYTITDDSFGNVEFNNNGIAK